MDRYEHTTEQSATGNPPASRPGRAPSQSGQSPAIDCSVVVPFHNEAESVRELHDRLTRAMRATGVRYELVFVDDGSTDRTLPLLRSIAADDPCVIVVELRRNFGQTGALAAGFDHAVGRVIVAMDGDLQHRPEEIPLFLAKLDEGYDIVSGWRKNRVDNFWLRRLPSKIANKIASWITGVAIHDFGTTFKAYRREIIEQVELFGEMHRFIPALLSRHGARIAEIPITNIVRPRGASNYGLERTFGVMFDLLTLRFLLGYMTKPLHFFGRIALACITLGVLLTAYILCDKLVYHVPIMLAHGPLAIAAMALVLVGFIFISTGLLGEILARVYFTSTGRTAYAVRSVTTSASPEISAEGKTTNRTRPSGRPIRETTRPAQHRPGTAAANRQP